MTLETIRNDINALDEKIIKIIIKRMESVKQLYPLKKSIEDTDREQEIIKRMKVIAEGSLSDTFIENFFTLIFAESKRLMLNEKKAHSRKKHDLFI